MSLERLYEARCPVCGKESLEDELTGNFVYEEDVKDYAGREVVCGNGCGSWHMPRLIPAAELQELVEREGEPELCGCGKHYVGAECPERR